MNKFNWCAFAFVAMFIMMVLYYHYRYETFNKGTDERLIKRVLFLENQLDSLKHLRELEKITYNYQVQNYEQEINELKIKNDSLILNVFIRNKKITDIIRRPKNYNISDVEIMDYIESVNIALSSK